MPDTATNSIVLPHPLDTWLLPLDEGNECGPDLEYDTESLDLAQAVSGKPESQFGPGEPPDWERARQLSESLFTRTRDLRVALSWARARLNLDGLTALPAALALIHGLLERFWDCLHPLPDADDRDASARLSVIGGLNKLDSLLGDVRNSVLCADSRLDRLRVRDVEVALGKLAARPGEAPPAQGQIAAMLADAADVADKLREQTRVALGYLEQIEALMARRVTADMGIDLTALRGMLATVQVVLPADTRARTAGGADAEVNGAKGAAVSSGLASGVHSVDTRQDAIRAIELVCAYLERSEPTNPAQLLLRRAARVIDKNFLQLVRELAPDAVKEVARTMGVDPNTISDEN